jgi:CarD family transcriptional regulator
LSFREKRMQDRARFLLVSELASVTGKPEENVETQIDTRVDKACAKVPVA